MEDTKPGRRFAGTALSNQSALSAQQPWERSASLLLWILLLDPSPHSLYPKIFTDRSPRLSLYPDTNVGRPDSPHTYLPHLPPPTAILNTKKAPVLSLNVLSFRPSTLTPRRLLVRFPFPSPD